VPPAAVSARRGGARAPPAGPLPWPAPAAKPVAPPEAAFSTDGKRFAAVVPCAPAAGKGEPRRLVAVWDVATGQSTDGVIVTPEEMPQQLPHTVQWCGPRHLLLGGTHLLDLDLSRVVWAYKLRPYTRMAAGS